MRVVVVLFLNAPDISDNGTSEEGEIFKAANIAGDR